MIAGVSSRAASATLRVVTAAAPDLELTRTLGQTLALDLVADHPGEDVEELDVAILEQRLGVMLAAHSVL